MLSFLARTFLLLTAAFGLGAIGGRATRRGRSTVTPSSRKAADRPEAAVGSEPAGRHGATSDVLLAGTIAGETGSDVGGSNILSEGSGPSEKSSAADAASPSMASPVRSEPPLPGEAENEGGIAVGASQATGDDDEPRAAFASYGGSGISAGFERVAETPSEGGSDAEATTRQPSRAHSRWSAEPPAEEAGQPASSAASPSPGLVAGVPHLPSATDLTGGVSSSGAAEHVGEDALVAKHRSETFDSDFRTVDYAKLGKESAPPPASGIGAPNDGWTVPQDGGLAGQEVFEESHAAFRSGGGSGPVRGAPEDDDTTASQSGSTWTGAGQATPSEVEPTPGTLQASQPDPAMPPVPAANRLSAARDGVPDDLTRISGIGPSIERLLFENGIFHFDQIAAWSEADARWADSLSGFRGRTQREKWIDQARAFAAEKA